jgi:hypothetical protein
LVDVNFSLMGARNGVSRCHNELSFPQGGTVSALETSLTDAGGHSHFADRVP